MDRTQQNNYDVFCISGDFLESSKDETLAEQIEWITQWIKKFEKPLFTCSGITHVPPANTKTSTAKNGDDWGDEDLYRAIKNKIINPKIILCGHMHKPTQTMDMFNAVSIYNTGVDKNCKIPNHHIIEI